MHHYLWFVFPVVISMHECCLFFSKIQRGLYNCFILITYLALDLRKTEEKRKSFEKFCSSSSVYFSVYQCIESRKKWNIRSWSYAKQRCPGPCRCVTGKSNGFCYEPGLSSFKQESWRHGWSYAIHLTFFCIAFSRSLHSMGSNYGSYFQWEMSQLWPCIFKLCFNSFECSYCKYMDILPLLIVCDDTDLKSKIPPTP